MLYSSSELATRIKELRLEKGLSLEQVADLVASSRQYVHRCEKENATGVKLDEMRLNILKKLMTVERVEGPLYNVWVSGELDFGSIGRRPKDNQKKEGE